MGLNRLKIADFFRVHREAAGLSPAEVARQLELASSEVLREYEAGHAKIPISDVISLLNIYNIPPDQALSLFYEIASSPDQVTSVLKKKSSG